VILDSCFSGRAIGETLTDSDEAVLGQLQVEGTYTLTSAPANRAAIILPGERHTAFTERLLSLLTTGSPHAGERITLGDIYRHLYAQLGAEGLPLPQQRGTATADLLGLVQNRRPTRMPAILRPNPPVSQATGPVALPWVRPKVARLRRAEVLFREAERIARHDKGEREYLPSTLAKIARGLASVNPDGAERIAASIKDKTKRIELLVEIAGVVAVNDRYRAEDIAASIKDKVMSYQALVEIAKALATTDPEHAEYLITSTTMPIEREAALVKIAGIMAPTDPYRAERIAAGISDFPSLKASALAKIAIALAGIDPKRAERLLDEAERTNATIPQVRMRLSNLAKIADMMTALDIARAVRILDEVERMAANIKSGDDRHDELYFFPLAELAKALAVIDPERAERIARSISDDHRRSVTLVDVAGRVAVADVDCAERIASTLTYDHDMAIEAIAEALAAIDPERAEYLASTIKYENPRAKAMAKVARAMAARDPRRAERLLEEAGELATSAGALAAVAQVWVAD
jgi:tetratricopeptide (TPR) repeat protein